MGHVARADRRVPLPEPGPPLTEREAVELAVDALMFAAAAVREGASVSRKGLMPTVSLLYGDALVEHGIRAAVGVKPAAKSQAALSGLAGSAVEFLAGHLALGCRLLDALSDATGRHGADLLRELVESTPEAETA